MTKDRTSTKPLVDWLIKLPHTMLEEMCSQAMLGKSKILMIDDILENNIEDAWHAMDVNNQEVSPCLHLYSRPVSSEDRSRICTSCGVHMIP